MGTNSARTIPSVCFSSFSIPKVINKDGQVIVHQVTKVALGVRRQPVLLPRPLHDPMAEHAIVLFDPTVDLIETSEELAARLALEAEQAKVAEEKKKLEANNPHKSLRAILGLKTKDELERAKKEIPKVPVVIDPKLSKVLRPHQVEGVKVRVSVPLRGFALTDVLALPVPVPVHDRLARLGRLGLHRRRRDGSRCVSSNPF